LEQREFFILLDEFFTRVTGRRYLDFATIEGFGDEVRNNAMSLSQRMKNEWAPAIQQLDECYRQCGTTALRSAKQLGGLKLVLGGGSRFTQTHLSSVARVLLYADTVLIPDPVLPWLEVDRIEERFRHVLILQQIFTLLHLKPLADAELEVPPVFVFQSWEKSLASRDPFTQESTMQLVTEVFSARTGRQFRDFSEVKNFAIEHTPEFLQTVEAGQLLVGPGGTVGQPVTVALEEYLTDGRTWRSAEFQAMIETLPMPLAVLLAIMERLEPQYHLMENSDELGAQPFVCIPAQSHYYALCSELFLQRLRNNSLVSDDTARTINAIQQPILSWLSNLPMETLVELRKNNENERFRQHLQHYVHDLHAAGIEDLDRVAAEVSRGISSLIAANDAELRRIQEKYQRKFSQVAAFAVAAVAVSLVPTLAPFLSAPPAPFILAGKYVWDKFDERSEKESLSRSLMGVLARAKRSQEV
jgi:hypothetical protein